MNPSIIRVENLSKSYSQLPVLRGLTFSTQPGRVTGIVGPNACGKTTLIKCILGLVVPDQGDVLIDGQSILQNDRYRRLIGYMPQNPDFPSNLTLTELFEMLIDIRNEPAPGLPRLLEYFHLKNFATKPFGQLSGGTKQKVAAVAAFMFEPPILILDEPTVGLDPVSALQLKTLIQDAAQKGCTVLFVSHIMTEVEQLVSDMLFVLDGKIQFQGDLGEIKTRAAEPRLDEAVVKLISQLGSGGGR